MIQITAHLVDFMDAAPIVGADVAATIQVVPRWREVISTGPDGDESDRPPGPRPPNRPVTILEPRLDLAESFQRQGVSDEQGIFNAAFNVAQAFEQLRRLRESGRRPEDVVAFVTMQVAQAGLERTVRFGSLTAESGSHLLNENSRLQPVVAMDFAKAIVGHTTENSVKLWFNLHSTIRSGNRYICEIEQRSPNAPAATRTLPVTFEDRFPEGAASTLNTAVVSVRDLQPATLYRFRLRLQSVVLARGQFATAPAASADRLSLVFGSCHLPTQPEDESLERWRSLARRDDYDLMLLIGDQIYGDGIEQTTPNSSWFERYVNRYHQLWTYQPMRKVLRKTPTYMVLDDHEVVDDWGVISVPNEEKNLSAERIEAATRAYRIFQQSHSPASRNNIHYNFNWGPAAFFVLDNRSRRRPPAQSQTFPILGQPQWEALQSWANAPATLAADIIFFVAPVPIAFLPVEEIRRLIEELKDTARDTGSLAGFLAGAFFGGLSGGALGAVLGGYAGHKVAESEIEEKGLADVSSRDLADMWTYEPNQSDLTRVLDTLFNLANDIQPDGRLGPRPRAVFVLGGDVHSGSMHVIRSERADNRYRRNPLLYQITSSAISHEPVNDKTYEQVIKHIQDGQSIGKLDLVRAGFDAEALIKDVIAGDPAEFVLDSKQGKNYAAQFVDLLVGRNFGRIQIERTHRERRVYQIYLFVEGQHKSIQRAIELDLDAEQIMPKDLLGAVLFAEGKVTFLRVHDVGSGYGPTTDRLDAEVIIQLDTQPEKAFGFQLRNGVNQSVHRQMLKVLREAFNREQRVRIDYTRSGLRNGYISRVAAV